MRKIEEIKIKKRHRSDQILPPRPIQRPKPTEQQITAQSNVPIEPVTPIPTQGGTKHSPDETSFLINNYRITMITLNFLLAFGSMFLLFSYFAYAHITITPREVFYPFNQELTFLRGEQSQHPNFEIVSTNDSLEIITSRQEIADIGIGYYHNDLRSRLKNKLLEKISREKTNLFSIVEGSETFFFGNPQEITMTGNEIKLKIEGRVQAFLTQKKKTAQFLIEIFYPGEEGAKAKIVNWDDMIISVPRPSNDYNRQVFSIQGVAHILWDVHPDDFSDLVGLSITNANTQLQTHPEIGDSELKIFPSWIKKIPNDPDRIRVFLLSKLREAKSGVL